MESFHGPSDGLKMKHFPFRDSLRQDTASVCYGPKEDHIMEGDLIAPMSKAHSLPVLSDLRRACEISFLLSNW